LQWNQAYSGKDDEKYHKCNDHKWSYKKEDVAKDVAKNSNDSD